MNLKKSLIAIAFAAAAMIAPDCRAISLDEFVTSFTALNEVKSEDIGIDKLTFSIPGMETAVLHRLDSGAGGDIASARNLVGTVDGKYHITTVKGDKVDSHVYGDASTDPASLVIVFDNRGDKITVIKATGSPDMIDLVKMDVESRK